MHKYTDLDVTKAVTQILQKIDQINLRRTIFQDLKEINITSPLIAREFYKYPLKNNLSEEIINFAICIEIAGTLMDHIVDGDPTEQPNTAIIRAEILESIASDYLSMFGGPTISYFEMHKRKYLTGTFLESSGNPSLEKIEELLTLKANAYTAIFGSSALAGGIEKTDSRRVEEFSRNYYIACQILDDRRDRTNTADKINLTNFLGEPAITNRFVEAKSNCLTNLNSLQENIHTVNLKRILGDILNGS